jgi:hypothetical protein
MFSLEEQSHSQPHRPNRDPDAHQQSRDPISIHH